VKFELLTLTGAKFEGEAEQVSLVTTDGEIGILPYHEPLMAVAVPGPVTVKPKQGREQTFATFGGMLEVGGNRVRLLADEAEHEDELVAKEIEAALREAEALKAAAKDKHELARAQELVDRQTVRLGVARLARRHRERSGGAPGANDGELGGRQ
jgi:F-type H+-transporting ATPase subunit epsilon